MQGDGGKAERDQLRREMLEQNAPLERIAVEMTRRLGYRPRAAWRLAHGWTQDEAAQHFNEVVGSSSATMTGKRISDYENWPLNGGKIKPTLTTLGVLATVYHTTPDKLIDHHDWRKLAAGERLSLRPTQSAQVIATPVDGKISPQNWETQLRNTPVTRPASTTRLWKSSSVDLECQNSKLSIHDLIVSAGHQSINHAEIALGQTMSDITLEDLTAEVERLTKEHLTDSLSIFSDTIQARNRVYRLLERKQYPRQTEHLYYLASVICALLADTSSSVGYRQAAEEQIRASWAYAEIIGHNALRFWCRGMQASMAFWRNRPQSALSLLDSANQWATEPIALAGLQGAVALFSAVTAQKEEARAALGNALNALESANGESEFYDRLGGMFSYSRPRFLSIATETALALGDTDQAEAYAAEAVTLYENTPPALRPFGNEASARIDLGHARLLRNDAEGAEEALQRVFELPPARRLNWIGVRLKDFQGALRDHNAVDSHLGRHLETRIEEYFDSDASDNFPTSIG